MPKDLPENVRLHLIHEKFSACDTKQLEKILAGFKNEEEDIQSLNLTRFISRYEKLPKDSENPFLEDFLDVLQIPQILIIGKPKCGRSRVAQLLSSKLNMYWLSPEVEIDVLLTKVKEAEENQETDEEGNLIDTLNPEMRACYNKLINGECLLPSDLLKLVNLSIDNSDAKARGVVIDLPLENIEWFDIIRTKKLHLPLAFPTHIVKINISDEESLHQALNIFEDPKNFKIWSKSDRMVFQKNKAKKGEDDEGEGEDEEITLPPDNELFKRPCEDLATVKKQIDNYTSKIESIIEESISSLKSSFIISINGAGLLSEEIVDVAITKLGISAQRALPKKIEEAGSFKDLLTAQLPDGAPMRGWSPFGNVDIVSLFEGKIVTGNSDFAYEMNGRVYAFENEENSLKFSKHPSKYILQPIRMPLDYNMVLIGPKFCGIEALAYEIANSKGWKIIDAEKILQEQYLLQKDWTEYPPCNPETSIHISQADMKLLAKGESLSLKYLLPLMAKSLGLKLVKKPPPPRDPEEIEAEEEAKRKEEEKKKKMRKKKGEEEKKEPEKPKIEDIPLNELVLEPNTPPLKGFLFLNFPLAEEQTTSFEDFKLKFDSIVVVNDRDEEFKSFKARNLEKTLVIENETAAIENIARSLKDIFGEENVKEVALGVDDKETLKNIEISVNPFFPQVDNEELISSESENPILFGHFGPFCPVTFSKEGWLAVGNEEQELLFQHRRYRFLSEIELNEFKNDPLKYAIVPKVPEPRIFFMGPKGSGLTTLLKNLCAKFKISCLNVEDELLKALEVEKKKRIKQRLLNRPFKIPECMFYKSVDEEGKEIDDPEIIEDPADFDKREHEISILKQILSSENIPNLFNINFFNSKEETLTTPILELFSEAKRLPEAIVSLKLSEKDFFSRKFDEGPIKEEYNKRMEERKSQKEKEKEEARRAAEEAGEEYQEEEETGEDPEAPNYDEMVNAKKEEIKARFEEEVSKVNEWIDAFREKLIPVIEIETDTSIDRVLKKVSFQLKPFLEKRENLFLRHQVKVLDEAYIKQNEESLIYKPSKIGKRPALKPHSTLVERKIALVFNNRIYYCRNEEEKQILLNEPSKLFINRIWPSDVNYNLILSVVGKPKSGKTTIIKRLCKDLGLVRIKISHILRDFIENGFSHNCEILRQKLKKGEIIEREALIGLICERISKPDCVSKGFILDGFPSTVDEAHKLSKAGIVPDIIFSIHLDDQSIMKRSKNDYQKILDEVSALRTKSKRKPEEGEEVPEEEPEEGDEEGVSKKKKDRSKFDYLEYRIDKFSRKPDVLKFRMHSTSVDLPLLENFYSQKFNNLVILDSRLSVENVFLRVSFLN